MSSSRVYAEIADEKPTDASDREIHTFDIVNKTSGIQGNYKSVKKIFPFKMEEVFSLAIYQQSQDSSWVIIGKADCTISAYDLATANEKLYFKAHSTPAYYLVVYKASSNQTFLVSGSGSIDDNPSVILWELPDGIMRRRFFYTSSCIGVDAFYLSQVSDKEPSSNSSFRLSSKAYVGDVIISAFEDGSGVIWNLHSGEVVCTVSDSFAYDCSSMSISLFGSDCTALLVIASSESATVWNLSNGGIICKLKGSFSNLCTISFDGDKSPMIMTDNMNVYDMFTGKEVSSKSFELDTSGLVWISAIECYDSKTAPLVLTGSSDGYVAIYDFNTCTRLLYAVGHSSEVDAVVMFCDPSNQTSYKMITGGKDNETKIWAVSLETDAVTFILLSTIYPKRTGGHAGYIRSLTTATINSRPYVFSAGEDIVAIMWDLESGEEIKRFQGHHKLRIETVCVMTSLNSPVLLTAGLDAFIIVWDINLGTYLYSLPKYHTDYIREIVPCGIKDHPYSLVSVSRDKKLILWDLAIRDKLEIFETEHKEDIRCLGIHVSSTLGYVLTGSNDDSAIYSKLELSDDKKFRLTTKFTWEFKNVVLSALLHVVDNDVRFCIVTSKISVFIYSAVDGTKLRELQESIVGDKLKNAEIRTKAIYRSPTALSDNDIILVTGCTEGSISLWDVASGCRLRSLVGGHDDDACILSMALSATDTESGKSASPILITGGDDKKICKWNLDTTSARYTLDFDMSGIFWVKKFQPRGSNDITIVVASRDGYIRLVDSKSYQLLSVLNIPKTLGTDAYKCSTIAIAAAADGINPIIITTDFAESSYIWNLQTKQYYEIRGEYVAVLDDVEKVYLLSHNDGDKFLVLWDIETGGKMQTTNEFSDEVYGYIAPYRIPGQEPMAAVGSRKGPIPLFSIKSGEVVASLEGLVKPVYDVRVNIDSKIPMLAAVNDDFQMMIWNLTTYDILQKIFVGNGYFADFHKFPDDTLGLLYVSEGTNVLNVWNPADGTKTQETQLGKNSITVKDQVSDVAIITPGKDVSAWIYVYGTYDGQLQFRPYDNLETLAVIDSGHSYVIHCIDFYAVNQDLYAISASEDGSVIIWNVDKKKLVSKIRSTESVKGVSNLAVIQRLDGRNFVAMGFIDKIAAVWDLDENKFVCTLEGGHTDEITAVITINFTGDDTDTLVLTASKDKTVRYWNLKGELQTISLKDGHTDDIHAMIQFSKSSKSVNGSKEIIIVTGSADKNIILWNAENGNIIMKLTGGHTKGIIELDKFTSDENVQYIVSAGIDGSAIVWNAFTGIQIRKLRGHDGAIQALATFKDKKRPLIATGGKDGSIIIWSTFTGNILQKYKVAGIDKTDYVAALAFENNDFVGRKQCDHTAKLYIGNSAGVIEVREIYFENFPPLPMDVNKAFDYDLNSERDDWIAIAGLSKRFQRGFWMENLRLFERAVIEDKVQFLQLFQSSLTDCIHRAVYDNRVSLLRRALLEKNGACTKVVLACWSEALQRSVQDSGDQNWWHPSISIEATQFKSDLLLLSETFPILFSEFLCSLKLIEVSPSPRAMITALPRDSRSELKCAYMISSNLFDEVHKKAKIKTTSKTFMNTALLLFEKLSMASIRDTLIFESVDKLVQLLNQYDTVQPVTSLFLPVRDLASVELLQAIVDVSKARKSVDIFNNDAGKYALRCAWEAFGYQIHLVAMILYILFVIVFTTSILSFQPLLDSSASIIAWIIQALVLLLTLTYAVDEGRQISSEAQILLREKLSDGKSSIVMKVFRAYSRTLTYHFLDIWNNVDLGVIGFCTSGTIIRFIYWRESYTSRLLLSIASVFVYFKFLYFLRPFEQSGPLVTMVLKIAFDIRYFLLVLFIVLIGFAQAFYVISYGDTSLSFGRIDSALLNAFLYMLGGFDQDFSDTSSPNLGVALLVLFLLFMTILMLNLLIALMGESFSEVSANKIANWRLEQASIILEQFFKRSDRSLVIPPLIHVLKYTSDIDAGEGTKTIAELEKSFKKQLTDMQTFMRKENDQLKELMRQQAELQNDILMKVLSKLNQDNDKT